MQNEEKSRMVLSLKLFSDITMSEWEGVPLLACYLESIRILVVTTARFKLVMIKMESDGGNLP